MASFAVRLAETAPTWGRAVAPIAEWVATELWSTTSKRARPRLPATRLTQNHKREAKSVSADIPACTPPRPMRICRGCGASVKRDRDYCAACGLVLSTDKILEVSQAGRLAAQSPQAQASRARRNAETQSLNMHGKVPKGNRSVRKCMIAKSSLGSPSSQSRQLQLNFAFPGHMLRIFAEESAARMHGIGKSWRGWNGYRWSRWGNKSAKKPLSENATSTLIGSTPARRAQSLLENKVFRELD